VDNSAVLPLAGRVESDRASARTSGGARGEAGGWVRSGASGRACGDRVAGCVVG